MLFLLQFLGGGREKLVHNLFRRALVHPLAHQRDHAGGLRASSVAQFGLDGLYRILDLWLRFGNQIVSTRLPVFSPIWPKYRPLEFSVAGE